MGRAYNSIWFRFKGIKEKTILMIGFDNAGKTTVLFKLKLGKVTDFSPTVGINVQEIKH